MCAEVRRGSPNNSATHGPNPDDAHDERACDKTDTPDTWSAPVPDRSNGLHGILIPRAQHDSSPSPTASSARRPPSARSRSPQALTAHPRSSGRIRITMSEERVPVGPVSSGSEQRPGGRDVSLRIPVGVQGRRRRCGLVRWRLRGRRGDRRSGQWTDPPSTGTGCGRRPGHGGALWVPGVPRWRRGGGGARPSPLSLGGVVVEGPDGGVGDIGGRECRWGGRILPVVVSGPNDSCSSSARTKFG